jgi:VIT1/CCC1 family predicted Fe2+/Mn2+ transporter
VEHHVYSIKPGLTLDLVHKLVHQMIPMRWKYHFFVRAQMRERRANDAERANPAGVADAGGAAALHRQQRQHHELAGQRNRRRYAESRCVEKVARVLVAFIGGAALLIPMLIMTPVSPGENTKLITVCVSVLLFGLLMGAGTKANHQEVLAASAAYAAVMVVYIGSATQNGTGS